MSRSVDDRIVRMQFDNKEFEKHAQTSMSTLDKLKKSLEFKNVAKGFQNVNNGIQSITFSPIQNGIDAVTSHFSRMEMTWSMVLANMINKAIDTGTKMVNALTIDPVKTGFQEYETQMNAIQTIWANTKDKGTSMEDITQALDELNKYADQTIYNFTQMTNNIGRFTAAGVELDTAVTAIKGISNLAAISGASAEDASRAMYQLSQAMASGTIKLMDWNSVVNANMGGEGFQNVLKETAREHGIAVDAIIKQSGSFRESLSKEWLTTEVLVDALEKYTDTTTELGKTATDAATKVKTFTQLWDTLKESVQSGWSESWRLIIGDFEEARNIFTKLSDALQGFLSPFAEARNAVLKTWAGVGDSSQKTSEHIDDVSESINELDEVAMRVIRGDYKNGIEIRFPLLEADGYDAKAVQQRVNEIVYGVKKASDDATKAVTEPVVDPLTGLTGREMVIKGLSAQLERLRSALLFVKSAFQSVFPPMTGERLIELSRKFMEFSQKPIIATENILGLRKTLQGIFSVFSIGIKSVKFIIKVFTKLLGIIDPLNSGIFDFTGSIGEFIYNLDKGVLTTEFFTDAVDKVVDTILKLPGKIRELVTSLGDFIGIDFEKIFGKVSSAGSKAFDGVVEAAASLKKDPIKSIEDFTDMAIEKFKPLEWIGDFFKTLWEKIKSMVSKIVSGIKWVKDGIVNLFKNIKNPFADITLGDVFDASKIFAVGSFGAAMISITTFMLDLKKSFGKSGLLGIVDSIKDVFGSITGVFVAFQTSIKANILLKIAIAVAILAASLIAISAVKQEPLKQAMLAIGELFAGIILSLKMLNSVEIVALGGALTGLALAVASLTSSIVILGRMNQDKVNEGLSAILIMLFSIAGAMKLMMGPNNARVLFGIGSAIRSFAVAINMLIIPIAILGVLSEKVNIWTPLLAIGLMLAGLTVAVNVLAKTFGTFSLNKISGIAGVLISFGVAINMLVTAMLTLSLLEPEDMLASFLVITGLVLVLTAAIAGLAGIAKAGKVDLFTVSLGLASLVGALSLLLPQIAVIALLPTKKLAIAVALISGLILVISLSLFVISKASKGLSLLIGVVTALTLASAIFVSSIISLLGAITDFANADLTGIKDRLSEACDAIIENGPKMKEAFVTLIRTGLGAWNETRGEIIKTIIDTIVDFLEGVRQGIKEITAKFIQILIAAAVGTLTGLTENSKEITDAIVKFIIAFTTSISESIEENSDELIIAIEKLINAIVVVLGKVVPKLMAKIKVIVSSIKKGLKTGLNDLTGSDSLKLGDIIFGLFDISGIPSLVSVLWTFISDVFSGFADGFDEGIAGLAPAFEKLIQNLVTWLTEQSLLATVGGAILGEIWLSIEEAINNFKEMDAGEIIEKLIKFLLNPLKTFEIISMLWDAGWELIGGIIKGIHPGLYRVGEAIGDIGPKVKEWIAEHTIIDEFIQAGRDFIDGIIQGIKDKFEYLKTEVTNVAEWVVEKFRAVWDINSPSKVMIPMGSAIDEGVAVGIQKGASYIDKSINTMSDDMYTSLSKTMGDLNDAIYTDIDYEPQIKPVLNLDDVTRNANYLNGMFTNQEIALRQLGASMSTNVSFDDIQNGRYDGSNVVSEIQSLRSDVNKLNESISHMQVVMDSGALVGSIAAPMDSALGRRHIYSKRGV